MGKVVKLFKKEFVDFKGLEDFGIKVIEKIMEKLREEKITAIGIETKEETMLNFGFLFHDYDGILTIRYEPKDIQNVLDIDDFVSDLFAEVVTFRRSEAFFDNVERSY